MSTQDEKDYEQYSKDVDVEREGKEKKEQEEEYAQFKRDAEPKQSASSKVKEKLKSGAKYIENKVEEKAHEVRERGPTVVKNIAKETYVSAKRGAKRHVPRVVNATFKASGNVTRNIKREQMPPAPNPFISENTRKSDSISQYKDFNAMFSPPTRPSNGFNSIFGGIGGTQAKSKLNEINSILGSGSKSKSTSVFNSTKPSSGFNAILNSQRPLKTKTVRAKRTKTRRKRKR